MKKYFLFLITISMYLCVYSQQQAYFVDGYHGGIYGHYPVEWKTQFIVDQLAKHPDWRIGLEIEPETWDTVAVRTPQAYSQFQQIAGGGQVEFTNPAYAQPYLYNISGESIIRQFQYGLDKIHKHFPNVKWLTYSVEEPCFTSCLPQVLRLFGVKYAVLKCPNTCWGGYSAAYGGELVNWIGPDGTSILTVPRYACEDLQPKSVWQTIAWGNSREYLDACYKAGISHPVGMTYQDAGWKNGPWLGNKRRGSIYVRWMDYIEQITSAQTNDNYFFTQEDVLPNLMWGSQVMQRIGRQVRNAENRIVMAEKLGAMAFIDNEYRYSQDEVDEAWRTLMLAQHHDSWIVPYNGLHKKGTWADAILRWTNSTCDIVNNVAYEAINSYDLDKGPASYEGFIRVFNTLGDSRTEVTSVLLPDEYRQCDMRLYDAQGVEQACWLKTDDEGIRLFFVAETPSFGYTTYGIKSNARTVNITEVDQEQDIDSTEYILENDEYRIVFDLTHGGAIRSLQAKRMGNKEFVSDNGCLGELKGFFYEEGRFRSNVEDKVKATLISDDRLVKRLKLEGKIASHPYTQIITLVHGRERIDFELTVNWLHNTGIGEYKEEHWNENRRAFCDDRYKLRVLFPTSLKDAHLFKNAPFDVCESNLENTYFNSWDGIKHNIILHWVDIVEPNQGYGLALFTDHTTSYSYGQGDPLGLTVQYSGQGLWGRDYSITGPTYIRYAIVPHQGQWDQAGIAFKSDEWNEPLITSYLSSTTLEEKSLVDLHGTGYQISAAQCNDGKVILRLFNSQGDNTAQKMVLGMQVKKIEEVDLRGNRIAKTSYSKRLGKVEAEVSMPRFGLKTYRITIR